jgi:hypothetical protein
VLDVIEQCKDIGIAAHDVIAVGDLAHERARHPVNAGLRPLDELRHHRSISGQDYVVTGLHHPQELRQTTLCLMGIHHNLRHTPSLAKSGYIKFLLGQTKRTGWRPWWLRHRAAHPERGCGRAGTRAKVTVGTLHQCCSERRLSTEAHPLRVGGRHCDSLATDGGLRLDEGVALTSRLAVMRLLALWCAVCVLLLIVATLNVAASVVMTNAMEPLAVATWVLYVDAVVLPVGVVTIVLFVVARRARSRGVLSRSSQCWRSFDCSIRCAKPCSLPWPVPL